MGRQTDTARGRSLMKHRFGVSGLVLAMIGLPVLAGLAGTIGPAFGFLPVLGGDHLTLDHFADLAAQPHLWRSSLVSFATAIVTTGLSLVIVMLFTAGYAGTRMFSRIQHMVSPLLAVPHAAAAFGLAFLAAPSGLVSRAMTVRPTGWCRRTRWD
jgi:putative thiamine transport system permease protein